MNVQFELLPLKRWLIQNQTDIIMILTHPAPLPPAVNDGQCNFLKSAVVKCINGFINGRLGEKQTSETNEAYVLRLFKD